LTDKHIADGPPSVAVVRMVRGALIGLSAAIIALIVVVTIMWLRINDEGVRNCQQTELVKSALRGAVQQQARALGTPGAAGYMYYRQHPDELRAARKETLSIVADFQPRRCE
jgi:hypothetical protein